MKLISVPQAAARLGCSRSHVYDLVKMGALRRYNISARGKSKVRLDDEDVDRYIREAEQPVGGAA